MARSRNRASKTSQSLESTGSNLDVLTPGHQPSTSTWRLTDQTSLGEHLVHGTYGIDQGEIWGQPDTRSALRGQGCALIGQWGIRYTPPGDHVSRPL